MKVTLIAAIQVLIFAALAHCAAVPAIDHASATNAVEGSDRAGKSLSSRTMDPVFLPFDNLKNKITFKPLKFDYFNLEKVKDFSLVHKDFIIWGVVGAVAIVALALIVSLFTGFDGVVKSFSSGMNTVKARADDMGLKMDAEHLNVLTSRVFGAIDSWSQKNSKSD